MWEKNKLTIIAVAIGLAIAVGAVWLTAPESRGTIQRPRPEMTAEERAASRKEVADRRARIASKEVAQTATIPPVGDYHELNQQQITYCLSENIRIEAGRPFVSGAEAEKNFDAIVKDYNSRCGNYRYRSTAYNNAKRQVDAISGELKREGQARFERKK